MYYTGCLRRRRRVVVVVVVVGGGGGGVDIVVGGGGVGGGVGGVLTLQIKSSPWRIHKYEYSRIFILHIWYHTW